MVANECPALDQTTWVELESLGDEEQREHEESLRAIPKWNRGGTLERGRLAIELERPGSGTSSHFLLASRYTNVGATNVGTNPQKKFFTALKPLLLVLLLPVARRQLKVGGDDL